MVRHLLVVFVAVSGFWMVATGARAADATEDGKVALAVTPDHDQPMGSPIVVTVKLTNVGTTPIRWWCGGPAEYPGAEHFVVKVRYGPTDRWETAAATNGQYIQGSGTGRELKPGDSIMVPLAIPIRKTGSIFYSIEPREWRVAHVAEGSVTKGDAMRAVRWRSRVIAAVIAHTDPFLEHVAATYPDPAIIDTMLKLVTVDDPMIARSAAEVLARQPALPAAAGASFAGLVDRWLARSPKPEWGGLQENIVTAALKTQSELARVAVLNWLNRPGKPRSQSIAIAELRLSPGDEAWLLRARKAIASLQIASDGSEQVTPETQRAIEWLDSRIINAKRETRDNVRKAGATTHMVH